MNKSLDRISIPVARVFALLDKPCHKDGLPQFGAIMQSYVMRHQCRQDLVFETGHTTFIE